MKLTWKQWVVVISLVLAWSALVLFLSVRFDGGGDFTRGVSVLNNLVAISAIAIGAFVTVFILDGFTARLNVRLSARWEADVVVIRMEVENPSRIRAAWPYARLQVLQYELKEGDGDLSEWVAFKRDAKRVGEPDPIVSDGEDWPALVRVFHDERTKDIRGTQRIYPGEVLSGERVVQRFKNANVIHAGLQVKLLPHDMRKKSPTPEELGAIYRSHTATCFVTPPTPA